MTKRFHIKDFADWRVTYPRDAYFAGYIDCARYELTRNNLTFDPDTGIVYEGRSWIERPSGTGWTDADRANYSMLDSVWDDFFSRHIRARAARLANRDKGIG